jgi:membrane-associated phospholipid phosphatase
MGAAIGAYALITALLAVGQLTAMDRLLADWSTTAAPRWLVYASQYAAYLGQGGPLAALTLAIAGIQAVRHKDDWWKPISLWVAAFVLEAAVVVPVKMFTRRGAPADHQADAIDFFSKGFCGTPACESYPSGHAVNAIVWYGLAILLIGNLVHSAVHATVRFTTVAIVALATVVSGYHWATDTLAGVVVGVGIYAALSLLHARWGMRDRDLRRTVAQLPCDASRTV